MELDWTWDIELWKTADKYRLPGLMALARKDIMGIGESLETDEPLADDEMPGFAAMIRALYLCGPSNAARRLRLKIVREYREMASEIGQEPELRRLAEDVPEFVLDMLQCTTDQLTRKRRMKHSEYHRLAEKYRVSFNEIRTHAHEGWHR